MLPPRNPAANYRELTLTSGKAEANFNAGERPFNLAFALPGFLLNGEAVFHQVGETAFTGASALNRASGTLERSGRHSTVRDTASAC
ncbi:MAG TPA: hypothetical protein ENJ54_01710 [Chloroflexi bacterium]|nr:hypothetical protein [Chloroflexota bacterium]